MRFNWKIHFQKNKIQFLTEYFLRLRKGKETFVTLPLATGTATKF